MISRAERTAFSDWAWTIDRWLLSAILMLIALVGGRIVPSFTNNWLTRNNPGRLPIPFSRYDAATVGLSALALLAWIAAPVHPVASAILIAAGALQLVRLARWAGDRTFADRLVLVLHAAYAFVPAGLAAGLAGVRVRARFLAAADVAERRVERDGAVRVLRSAAMS